MEEKMRQELYTWHLQHLPTHETQWSGKGWWHFFITPELMSVPLGSPCSYLNHPMMVACIPLPALCQVLTWALEQVKILSHMGTHQWPPTTPLHILASASAAFVSQVHKHEGRRMFPSEGDTVSLLTMVSHHVRGGTVRDRGRKGCSSLHGLEQEAGRVDGYIVPPCLGSEATWQQILCMIWGTLISTGQEGPKWWLEVPWPCGPWSWGWALNPGWDLLPLFDSPLPLPWVLLDTSPNLSSGSLTGV